jgi:hypothetical protein
LVNIAPVVSAVAVVVVSIGIRVQVKIADRIIHCGIGFTAAHNDIRAIGIVIAVPVVITVPV